MEQSYEMKIKHKNVLCTVEVTGITEEDEMYMSEVLFQTMLQISDYNREWLDNQNANNTADMELEISIPLSKLGSLIEILDYKLVERGIV